jgi:imidazolonepropionase-like amidohydrolase
LYIEQRLPPVELLLKHNCKIVLGTDSYASNWQLSIAAEIKTICTCFPQLELEKILQWATKNGAGALRQISLGTIEKGKNPGLVLLETSPGNENLITGESRRII